MHINTHNTCIQCGPVCLQVSKCIIFISVCTICNFCVNFEAVVTHRQCEEITIIIRCAIESWL